VGTTAEKEFHIGPGQESAVTIPVGEVPNNDDQWHLNISFDMAVEIWNDYESAVRGERHIALKTIEYLPLSPGDAKRSQ
jgi:hypothetical protein